jgi:hypothetical protein
VWRDLDIAETRNLNLVLIYFSNQVLSIYFPTAKSSETRNIVTYEKNIRMCQQMSE